MMSYIFKFTALLLAAVLLAATPVNAVSMTNAEVTVCSDDDFDIDVILAA